MSSLGLIGISFLPVLHRQSWQKTQTYPQVLTRHLTSVPRSNQLGHLGEELPSSLVSSPELEVHSKFATRLLHGVGPNVLPTRAKLDLNGEALAARHEMHGAVAIGLRVLDVVALTDNPPRLQEPASYGVPLLEARQHRPNPPMSCICVTFPCSRPSLPISVGRRLRRCVTSIRPFIRP